MVDPDHRGGAGLLDAEFSLDGALGIVLLITVGAEVPQWLTATIGLGTIAAAFASSVRHNRRSGRSSSSPRPLRGRAT